MVNPPNQAIPDDPALGKFQAIFTTNRLQRLIQGGAIYVGLVIILQALFANADEATSNILFILYPTIALLVFWFMAHGWNREVILFERGFSYRRGSQIRLLRYDNILTATLTAERVRLAGVLRRDRYLLKMTTDLDEMLIVDSTYTEPAKLTATLEKAIAKARLPIVQAQLARGERVAFGAIECSAQGIHVGEDTLAWADYQGYLAQGDALVLAHWQSVPLATLENTLLLVLLLKERTGVTNP